MTLLSGSRLGPYEILARLGAGGMGEVWRARDPRLSREIAVLGHVGIHEQGGCRSASAGACSQFGKTENPSLRAASANRSSRITNGSSAGRSSEAASDAASCSASADRRG